MSKEYLVTAYEIIRTVYAIEADSPEEAKKKLETADHSFRIVQEDYYDRERIDDDVEVNE